VKDARLVIRSEVWPRGQTSLLQVEPPPVISFLPMPRRSRTDLNVVPLPGRGRPEPPKDLTSAEQRVWRNIVDSSPDRWFDPAGQELLGLVVTQVVAAKEHAGRFRRIRSQGGPIEDELMILKAHRDATKIVIAGMAALRVSPQSRTRPGQAATAHAAGPGGPKPWNWRAEIVDPESVSDGDEPA
jgi:hypothetical protein